MNETEYSGIDESSKNDGRESPIKPKEMTIGEAMHQGVENACRQMLWAIDDNTKRLQLKIADCKEELKDSTWWYHEQLVQDRITKFENKIDGLLIAREQVVALRNSNIPNELNLHDELRANAGLRRAFHGL